MVIMYHVHKISQKAEQDLFTDIPPGYSPGYVGAVLGISRAGVHNAIKRGRLDAHRVLDDSGKLLAIIVTKESIDRYLDTRQDHSAKKLSA